MAKMSTKEPTFSERDRHNLESAIRLGKMEHITRVLDKKHPKVDLCGILHYALSYNQTEIASRLITRYKCPVDCRNESKETPLHVACKKGNLDMVRMLMKLGADPTACNEDNDTPLHRAAIYGNTNIIICLIDDFKCSPDIKGSGGTTILHQACRAGHVELAEILLTHYNRTLDPMSVDDHGNTPLHHAALDGLVDIVKLLIKYKCLVDCKNSNKQTPLHYACCKGHLSVVRMLVSEYKADLYTCSNDNSVPLIEAVLVEAVLGRHTDIVQCLIEEFKCSPNVEVSNGRTLLHLACSAGHVELTEMLLTRKYNLNPLSGDSNGSTPLHLAALNGMVEIVKLLITKYKCPVNCKDNNDKTPLHYACSGGHLNTVKTLISEHKADLLARGRDGSGPLHEAAQGGHTDLINCLIDKFQCSPEIKRPEDRTLLHLACSAGHVELTKTLLTSYKLNPLSGDSNGSTPLHLAALSGMVEIVELLITKYKCPVNCEDNNDKTPLHYACSGGHVHVIRMLKKHNANINAPDVHNNTPLHTAAIHGCAEVVKCLLKEYKLTSSIVGHEGSNILHQACKHGHVELAEMLIICYNLHPLSVDDNGNTPLHFAALSGMEGVANLLITKFNCPIDRKNNKNESPFDLAFANDHQSVIKLMEGIKILEDQSADKDSHLLPMIPREGYVCAAQSKICIVQLPSDGTTVEVQIDSVDDPTLHPKLKATEFLLTPVVNISPNTTSFSSDKQAVIELLKTVEQNGNGNKLIPIFSNTHPLVPPKWQDFDPDDLKVLHDRIVFNTRHFGLFTVITRFPTPTASVKVVPNKKDQKPVELTLLEVPNLKVVIPPSSIKSTSEMELKVSANFDHPIFCDEAVDASACIILGPHGVQFKERILIKIPLPGYAQITGMYSNAKLKFLHSNDPLDSESVNWSVIPDDEYQIVKEGDEYMGIVYSTHFQTEKLCGLTFQRKSKRQFKAPFMSFANFL